MATRIQIRRDTEANWSSNDPVLASGELALSTDVDKIKIGDSSTAWSGLSYATIGQAAVETLIDTAVTNLIGGAPEVLDTLKELADSIGNDGDFITTINASINAVETKLDSKSAIIISDSVPTNGPDGTESLQEGDIWYDRASGHAYMYYDIENETFVWVEMGGSDDIAEAALGTNSHDFSPTPNDGDLHNGYVYDASRTAWKVVRNVTALDEITDVTVDTPVADNVLMYNGTSSEWENVPGVRLDENDLLPLSALANGFNGASHANIADVEAELASITASVSDVVNDLATNYSLSADLSKLTVKSAADWGTDTSTPLVGSLNVETGGAEIKVKIGNGTDTYANLDYVPTNGSVASDIATAIAPLAPKADPTFSGTVSLPSTTSIGNVSDAEIAHLDGVTSGIQGQLDSLDTLKAPLADPTFTGTVSGIDKTMVGLSSVDNTSDVNKPVSTAQQAALDTKLDLAGGTLTGGLILNADPTQALGAVTKQYADSISEGLHIHASVVALSDSNIDLTGATPTTVIDGVTLADGDRVIINGQTDPAENGIYVFAATGSVFSRAEDFDTPAEAAGGDFVFVLGGTNYENTGWVKTSDTVATIGTDPINFTQFSGAGSVTGGTNVEVTGTQVAVVDAPVFAGTVDASAAGVAFSDGTQTQAGVPSLTTFVEKTASYQLDTLDHKDNVVEMNMSTAGTFTVPLDATLAWPVGASMDIFATGTGEITIAGEAGVTLNATPGLTLRTQWSSATIMKRGADNWVVYGDLKA